jgi:hypothetical protein
MFKKEALDCAVLVAHPREGGFNHCFIVLSHIALSYIASPNVRKFDKQ